MLWLWYISLVVQPQLQLHSPGQLGTNSWFSRGNLIFWPVNFLAKNSRLYFMLNVWCLAFMSLSFGATFGLSLDSLVHMRRQRHFQNSFLWTPWDYHSLSKADGILFRFILFEFLFFMGAVITWCFQLFHWGLVACGNSSGVFMLLPKDPKNRSKEIQEIIFDVIIGSTGSFWRVFEELSFSRLIVVPLFFIDFVGVRKENERLTAIPSELFQKYSLENRSGRFHLLLGLALSFMSFLCCIQFLNLFSFRIYILHFYWD